MGSILTVNCKDKKTTDSLYVLDKRKAFHGETSECNKPIKKVIKFQIEPPYSHPTALTKSTDMRVKDLGIRPPRHDLLEAKSLINQAKLKLVNLPRREGKGIRATLPETLSLNSTTHFTSQNAELQRELVRLRLVLPSGYKPEFMQSTQRKYKTKDDTFKSQSSSNQKTQIHPYFPNRRKTIVLSSSPPKMQEKFGSSPYPTPHRASETHLRHFGEYLSNIK